MVQVWDQGWVLRLELGLLWVLELGLLKVQVWDLEMDQA